MRRALNYKIVILGVLKNETCYKTGRVSTRDFTVAQINDKKLQRDNKYLLSVTILAFPFNPKSVTDLYSLLTSWYYYGG